MANEKYIMMSENPTGTGAFSMNRHSTANIGANSTAEGYKCSAAGNATHAEGNFTRAYGSYAHAEGNYTTANGAYAHAEGNYTAANGSSSHAGGKYTIAGYQSQTAIGEYNDNKEENIFEVGNGNSNARSNALELTKTGDLKIGGSYIDGSGNTLSMDSANEYTDQKIADLINGAPTTLDTLKEIADAMEESQGVVDALDKAIGTKANSSDLTDHTGNTNNPHNVTAEQTPYDPTESGLSAQNVQNAVDEVNTDIESVESQVTTNLLKSTLQTTTSNGIMITNNGDGIYTLNGTSNGTDINKYIGKFILDKYDGSKLNCLGQPYGFADVYLYFIFYDSDNKGLFELNPGTGYDSNRTKDCSNVKYISVGIYGRLDEGKKLNNVIIKPMITTNLNATYDDFVPFTGTTGKLNGDVAELEKSNENKMDKENPTGTGSFSMNRKADTTVGENSTTEGSNCEASGKNSHAEGWWTTASENYSHAEGYRTTASGGYAHSEGNQTTASEFGSHSEGNQTTASGNYSHAEGMGTTASGISSHTEGTGTTASGDFAHAEGYRTIAAGEKQHVEGKYNVKDTENKYAHIIGGGSSDTKCRNIHTVDWNGNAYYAGDVATASKSLNKAPQLIYTLKVGNTAASETIDVTNNYAPTHQFLYTINAAGSSSYEVGLVMYINTAYKFVPLASSNTSKTLGNSTSMVGITISFSTSEPGPHFSITRSGSSYGSTCNIYQLS